MANERKLSGVYSDVMSRAASLAKQGWEVVYFAVDTDPGKDSVIVMGELPDCPEPMHITFADD